ncbi:hypothetical protein B0T24DRAFT_723926 [Lasiosphaeria ovina]|uniref:Uncharacterized protein n=1 Tax=Lasiosphaeria ovina TaxID=92902 RepID=A0AAE0MZS8_9PEZI|nr:hypothetical protein B0T24DRAFT_723926 [Lasiosphaeria ovina]
MMSVAILATGVVSQLQKGRQYGVISLIIAGICQLVLLINVILLSVHLYYPDRITGRMLVAFAITVSGCTDILLVLLILAIVWKVNLGLRVKIPLMLALSLGLASGMVAFAKVTSLNTFLDPDFHL